MFSAFSERDADHIRRGEQLDVGEHTREMLRFLVRGLRRIVVRWRASMTGHGLNDTGARLSARTDTRP
ncbi:MAG: hypothetical protein JOZ34_00910 [Gammaproteobacteria bacterium]|nr:hypothetical protein [Gammaproteobacteria bacterium]